jgi:hypothetical protein
MTISFERLMSLRRIEKQYLIHIETNRPAMGSDLLRRLENIESRTASQIHYGLPLNSLG